MEEDKKVPTFQVQTWKGHNEEEIYSWLNLSQWSLDQQKSLQFPRSDHNFPLDSQSKTGEFHSSLVGDSQSQHISLSTGETSGIIQENQLNDYNSNNFDQQGKRKDARDLSQNLSSKSKTYISKSLSDKKGKQFSKQIRKEYQKFLKENKVENNQMILVFAYLFLKLIKAPQWKYTQFLNQFSKHLEVKKQEAGQKKGKQRQPLLVKIQANQELLVYLFELKGEQFSPEKVKNFCEPLFQGRQRKRINKPYQKVIDIQNSLSDIKHQLQQQA